MKKITTSISYDPTPTITRQQLMDDLLQLAHLRSPVKHWRIGRKQLAELSIIGGAGDMSDGPPVWVELKREIDAGKFSVETKLASAPCIAEDVDDLYVLVGESVEDVEVPSGILLLDPAHLMAAAVWATGANTGSSSKFLLATAMCGHIPRTPVDYPRDAHDLGRCLRLVEAVPSVVKAFPVLAAGSGRWKALTEAGEWANLTRIYRSYDGDTRYHAVTNRMQNLFAAATR